MSTKNLKEMVFPTKRSTKAIFGTNLRGSKDVNSIIGNAIRKMRNQEISFLEAEIFLEDLGDDVKGYLFEKNQKQIFIMWEKKRISELIFGQDENSIEDEDIIQAILLLEVVVDLTGDSFDFKKNLPILIHTPKIDKEEPNAQLLIGAVKEFENILQKDNYNFKEASDDDFSINWSKKIDVIEDILTKEFSTSDISEEKKEIPTTSKFESVDVETSEVLKEEVSKEKETKVEKEGTSVGEIEQLSLLGDDFVQVKHKVKPIKKAQKSKNSENKIDLTDVIYGLEQLAQVNELLSKLNLSTLNINSDELLQIRKASEEEKKKKYSKKDVEEYSRMIFKNDSIEEYWNKMGLCPKLYKKVKKFRENQVNNEMSFEQMMEIPSELKYRGWKEPLEEAIVAFITRNHLLIKGGAGSGKTTMLRTVGAILNMGVITATGSRDTSIETLIGFKDVQDGNIIVHDGAATRAARNGYIFVLEEGNAVMPSVLIQLHNLFDDTRRFYNEFSGETVIAHPHHVFATLINEGYEGTNEVNKATKDRLLGIEMPYMQPEELKEMFANYEAGYSEFQKELLDMDDISKKDIIILMEIARALQDGVNDGILEPEIASIRNITDLFEITRIYPIEKSIKLILNKYEEEDRRQIMEILDTVDILEFNASDILRIA